MLHSFQHNKMETYLLPPKNIKASYLASPMLMTALFLCKPCRDYLHTVDITYDEEYNVIVKVKLCFNCQMLNRSVRNCYRNTMFPPQQTE